MRRAEREGASPRSGKRTTTAFNAEVQLELDRLRERVKVLCKKVQASGASTKLAEAQARAANNDIESLEELLRQARVAKLEALEYNAHSKAELVGEVKRLHGILLEAKLESEEKDRRIEELELRNEKLRTRNEILATKLELQQSRFTNMLAEETQNHFQEMQELRAALDHDAEGKEAPDAEAKVPETETTLS